MNLSRGIVFVRAWRHCQGLKVSGFLEIGSYSAVFRELGTLLGPLKLGSGVAGHFSQLVLSRMELQDFLTHFNTVQICSLSPEVLGPSPAGGGWHIHIFQGRWVRGFNSGGSQPSAGEALGTPEKQTWVRLVAGWDLHHLLFCQKTSGPTPSSG